MKIHSKIFFLIVPILTISCMNATAKKTNIESLLNYKYKQSNTKLNNSYQKLRKNSPIVIKKHIKNSQIYWLQSRAKSCNTPGLDHPNNTRSTECFITENNKRIIELENNYKAIKDITNNPLKSLNFDGSNKYSLDFQTYCMCDVSIPYIDTKKNKLLSYNSCGNRESSQMIGDEITDLTFDKIGRLEITAINSYGSKYKVSFEHKINDIYTIVIEGKWGSIKDLNFPEFIAPESQSNIVKEDICSDFDG